VDLAVGSKPKRTIDLEVKRDGEIIHVELLTESKTRYDMGYAGFWGKILTEARMITPDSPAEKGGMLPGDVILTIEGQPVYFFKFVEIIQKSAGQELEFLIRRGGATLTLEITPRKEGDVGKIGIMQTAESMEKKFGFFSAFATSFQENKKLAFLVVNFIKDLLTGEASTRQLGGPIEIANFSYTAFRMGFMAMMAWIALISLQLGIINLFPIPVLDGGQILVIILEGIFRRDFSPKLKQIIMQIGFAIFIVLVVFIILNDVVKRLPNGWQSLWPF
jgi:regulator of sigma E protease